KLIAGDTLFAGSIGRTDLPGGSMKKIIQSLHGKLLALPDETVVVPGHGPLTTIGEERQSNPFLIKRWFTFSAWIPGSPVRIAFPHSTIALRRLRLRGPCLFRRLRSDPRAPSCA